MLQSGHGMRDGRTDGVKPIYPQQLRCSGGIMMINMIHVWLHLREVLMCFFVGLRSNVHTVWPVWYSILTHWWNDPPVRLLYSIFDLGYYVVLISDIGNGNGTIEQHPLPLPPPPRLLHDSATIWRICFIRATNITHEWTMCHVPLSG